MTVRGHMGPTVSHLTYGLMTALLLLTTRSLGRGVGGLDRVAGTMG